MPNAVTDRVRPPAKAPSRGNQDDHQNRYSLDTEAPEVNSDAESNIGKRGRRGRRGEVYEIVARVAGGQTFGEIAEDLEIAEADVKAALMYAEQLLEGEEIFPEIKGSHEVSR
jgi:uncharacterized protein (DUF433 family)